MGLGDASKSTSLQRIQVLGDGYVKYERDFALGQAQYVTVRVDGVLRLRLATHKIAQEQGYAYSHFGDARALCLF